MKRMKIAVAASLFAVASLVWGCGPREEAKPKAAPTALTLAVSASAYSGLIAVAETKGMFRDAGLDVAIRRYPSGLASLNAVLAGEAQTATVADFAFTGEADDDPSLRIIASIGLVNTNEIVARRDRGVGEPTDLRGRRIGVSLDTTSEYYLDSFLLTRSIGLDEATRVDVAPDGMIEALAGGQVDAISAWDTQVYEARRKFGENTVSWPAQNNQNYHWLLAAKEGFLRSSPEAARRLLRALVQAELFALAHADEAKDIIARWSGYDPEFIRQAWSGIRLKVSLSQSLVTSLEGGIRWRMRKEGKSGEPPNVLGYIDAKPLDEVEPRAVTLLR